MKTEYVAFLMVGLVLGLGAYMATWVLWLLNFAWQNAVAG